MADKDSGSKTEKPTPKKLQDARKKGQVAKSRDVTSTAELAVWLALGALAFGYAGSRLVSLTAQVIATLERPFVEAAPLLAHEALGALLAISAACLLPVVAVGVLSEYLQAGPVWTTEKLKPKLENMNPVEGVKRMFSMDNLVEVGKAIAKTAILAGIGALAIASLLPELAKLPLAARPERVGNALWAVALPLLAWSVVAFVLLSLLDAVYQRFSFMKKMRMSRRDIQQESKDNEGDPHIKAQRRQSHHEWSQRNAQQAARSAAALVVNPTHVAIAIDYDRATCPVPTIAAKGEEHVARAMRDAAEDAGVPIVRNERLARDLLARAEEGEVVPSDLFDLIAEVILWAREVRDEVERQREAGAAEAKPSPPRRAPPGEDLTRYPQAPR
jgi:type III secretion YscU/HrpY family protein